MNEKGDLTFRKIDDSSTYDQKLYDFVKARETVGDRVNLEIYTDSKGVATVGVGYAFNKSIPEIRADFASIGITLTDGDVDKINAIKSNPAAYRNMNADQLEQQLGGNFSFSLADEAQARDLFEVVKPMYVNRVISQFKEYLGVERGQELYDAVYQTEEMISLFSLAYNSKTLIGSGLTHALYDGERVKAYYEISIWSNKEQTQSMANRRYLEAEQFGLFSDLAYYDSSGSFVISQSEAGQLYVLWYGASTRQKILSYESLFSPVTTKQRYDASFGEDFNVYEYFCNRCSEIYGVDYEPGPTTDYIHVSQNTTGTPTQQSPTDENDLIAQIHANQVLVNGVTVLASLLGDVNTDRWNQAIANYSLTDGNRPGNNNTAQYSFFTPEEINAINSWGQLGNSTQTAINLDPADPLVLDLNGDGVKLTDFSSDPVLFDADHDGVKELSGWVSPQDGILVKDLNSNGIIDNISETLSEYFTGTEGQDGSPGTTPYAHGFAALQSLDSNYDGVFNSSDTDWNNVKVWIDANHDGVSFNDEDGDGVKDVNEATELHSLTELGITSIDLTSTTQSGLVRDGNEILASGSFTMSGQTKEALAANFLYNPNGHTFATEGNGRGMYAPRLPHTGTVRCPVTKNIQ